MKFKFEPITGMSYPVIEALMASPEIKPLKDLEFKLRLCIEEVAQNIASYAYKQGGWVEVDTNIKDKVLSITFRDAGVPFNPLAKPDPDTSLGIEDRSIGGLGIFLCKQFMDHLTYEYKDGCNVLTMKIKLP